MAETFVCATCDNDTTIKDCINYGDVDAANNGEFKSTDRAPAGGIIGFANSVTTITDCKNKGSIGSDKCIFVGGIIDYMMGALTTINTSTKPKRMRKNGRFFI